MALSPNKERIRLWVDALRSGEYEQCKYALRNGEGKSGHCCLGVATEEAIKHGGLKLRPSEVDNSGEPYDEGYTDGTRIYKDTLPTPVADWYGILENPELEIENPDYDPGLTDVNEPEYEPEFYTPHASEVNDDWGFDFDRIANLLEQKYLD